MSGLVADVVGGPCHGTYEVKRCSARMVFTVAPDGQTYALDEDGDVIEQRERAFLYEVDPTRGVSHICGSGGCSRIVGYRFAGNVDPATGEVLALDDVMLQRIREEGNRRVVAWARDVVEAHWAAAEADKRQALLERNTEVTGAPLTLDLDAVEPISVANTVVAAPPRLPLTESEREELADAFDPSLLQVGGLYRAIGPAVGSKLGPPTEVRVKAIVPGKGYRTDAPRQAAPLIAFGCEHFWTEVLDV